MHSRKPTVTSAPAVRDTGTAAARDDQSGYKCPKCGSWVVDTALHTGWHMEIEPTGRPAPPSESIQGWHAASEEITLLRTALGNELR